MAAKAGYDIITGGGPGVMAAGNEGAGPGRGFGLNIRLPFEQAANRFIDKEKGLIHYKYFFTRKLFLVKEATAFVLLPGGFGTFDESFEVLTLMQTGKTSIIPVVFLEPQGFGFWEPLDAFMESHLEKGGFIAAVDRKLYRIMNTPEAAIEHINAFYKHHNTNLGGTKIDRDGDLRSFQCLFETRHALRSLCDA